MNDIEINNGVIIDDDDFDISDYFETNEDNCFERSDEAKTIGEEDRSPIADLKKGAQEKVGKNYYNEEHMLKLIKAYHESLVLGEDNHTVLQCDRKVEREIMSNALLVVNAIINKYSYWRFAEFEELQAEGLKAIWVYLPKFDPQYGTSFNLFSLIVKRHLLNYTLKGHRYRVCADIDIHPEVQSRDNTDHSIFIEQMETELIRIVNENFIKEKRKKYLELTAVLIDYLVKSGAIYVGKLDMVSHFRGFGFKSSELKQYLDDIAKYKEELYQLAS